MREAQELNLCIDIKNKNTRKDVLDIFYVGRTVQLPVVDNRKVIGLLDVYDYIRNGNPEIPEIMIRDFEVAGKEKDIFLFKNSKQYILPIIDKNGDYCGFVNRLLSKVYLPNKEYMQVVEESLADIDTESGNVDIDEIKARFDALVETNYDGLYITVDKGISIGIHKNDKLFKGFSAEDIVIDDGEVFFSDSGSDIERFDVANTEILQARNEKSLSDELIPEGGIIKIVNNAKELEKVKKELRDIREVAEKYEDELEFLRWEQTKTDDVIAASPAMKKIINMAVKVAKVDSTVLIQGQSGVGKGVLSQIIHNNSGRKDGPFIKIDCSLIPENLLESELFGYVEGSFTGAVKGGKIGLIELANGGTLFLDEIGDLPLGLQAKLLRVLQDRVIVKVGATEQIPVDIRVIAATNRDLQEMVEQKTFRRDLYYRLNVVPIEIPPLSERYDDVKIMIQLCLKRYNAEYDLKKRIDPAAMRLLLDYQWPGNVRELENVIEYLVVTTNSDLIEKENLPKEVYDSSGKIGADISFGDGVSLKEAVDMVEEKMLREAMLRSGSPAEMAERLKVDRSTIVRKMQKHHMKKRF